MTGLRLQSQVKKQSQTLWGKSLLHSWWLDNMKIHCSHQQENRLTSHPVLAETLKCWANRTPALWMDCGEATKTAKSGAPPARQKSSTWGRRQCALTNPCLGRVQTDPFGKDTRPFPVNEGSFLISPEQLNESEISVGMKWFAFSFQISQRIPAIQHPCLSLNPNPCFSFDTCFPPGSSSSCLANNTNHLEDTAVLLPLC